MINYIVRSFQRKIARRFTKRYPVRINTFNIENYGTVSFTHWENPLVSNREISSEEVIFFSRFLREGDLAIDIGANVGHESLSMGLVTGKSGLTLSFDPNPYVFEILLKNVQMNADKVTIVPYNFAITDQEEEFYYNSSEASFSNGGISREKNNAHGKYTFKNKIKGIVLEPFLEKNYPEFVGKLKLIKIDTEGYDKEILESISNLLIKYRPAVISEVFFRNGIEKRTEQFNLLKSKGYSVYYFSDFHRNAEIIPIHTADEMMKWKHFDIFAIIE